MPACRPTAILVLAALAGGCAGGGEGPDPSSAPPRIDCTTIEVGEISPFVLDPFQRDLAIDTPLAVERHLDQTPELICTSLKSARQGWLSPIAYAAAHRPDAETIFPMLVERGATLADALPVAAELGKSRMLEWLLAEGVDPNSGDALILAAKEGQARTLILLLRAGAEPSRAATPSERLGHSRETALHHAARRGSVVMLNALLDAGADPNEPDAHGRPPLSDAVAAQSTDAIRVLHANGASVLQLSVDDRERLLPIAKRWRMTGILSELE